MSLIVYLEINGRKEYVRIRGGTGQCQKPAGGLSGKLRQHMVYVYASLSRLDFQGLLENAIIVF